MKASTTTRFCASVKLLCASCEPGELARSLADEIGNFLHFDHLYLIVLKENSKEIEHLVWGKDAIPLPDLPMEELPTWAAIKSPDPLHTPDWDAEERFPRFKEYAKKVGLGSSIRVPLTTPHRRLGVFRNQSRHRESIPRRRNRLSPTDRACRRVRAR